MAKTITIEKTVTKPYEVWIGKKSKRGNETYGAWIDVTPQIVERYLEETTTDNVKKISLWLKKKYGLAKSVQALRMKLTHEGVYVAQTPKRVIKATDAVSNQKKDMVIRIMQRTGIKFDKLELLTREDLLKLETWLKGKGYRDNIEKQIASELKG